MNLFLARYSSLFLSYWSRNKRRPFLEVGEELKGLERGEAVGVDPADLVEEGSCEEGEFFNRFFSGFFEGLEHLFGLADDGIGEAGEFGDVDAVAFVGAARDDVAEEDDAGRLFLDGDVDVLGGLKLLVEAGELPVVGGEESFCFFVGRREEVVGDGPGDRDAVVGACAAADLVEDDEGAGRGVVEDVRRLAHLDHECRLAAGEVVAGADAGEELVDDADPRCRRRHVGAHLAEDDDEGDLPDVGRLAGHVRAGDQHELAGGVEVGVVRDEIRDAD